MTQRGRGDVSRGGVAVGRHPWGGAAGVSTLDGQMHSASRQVDVKISQTLAALQTVDGNPRPPVLLVAIIVLLRDDPVLRTALLVPEEDEEQSPEEARRLAEARAHADRGDVITTEELLRTLAL